MLGAVLNHRNRYACLIGRSRSWANEDSVIFGRLRCLHLIVTHNGALSPQLREVLNDIEDEGVVVIDDKDAGHP
jgi:hypothetical protein